MAFEIIVDHADLEALVEKYIKSQINEQVATYLRTKLHGVVEGKLASMGMINGAPVEVEKVITSKLNDVITKRLADILPTLLSAEMTKRFTDVPVQSGRK